MKTSRKELLQKARELHATEVTDDVDGIRPYSVIAYSVGAYGITAKLVYSHVTNVFYYAPHRNSALFAL